MRSSRVAVVAALALAVGAIAARARNSAPPAPMPVDSARLAAIEAALDSLPPPRPARPEEFRATVVIATCTGTRVGPLHYLTAAHCLIDPATGRVRDWLAPPYPITLTNRLDSAHPSSDDVEAQVGIVAVHIHPRYRADVHQSFLDEDYRPDVALLVVDRRIEGIPIVPIGAWRVEPSRPLLLVGTRPPVLEPADAAPPDRRVKVVPARTIDADPIHRLDIDASSRVFFLTAGPAARYREYAISFGDSGGAAYDVVEGRPFVVGVIAVTLAMTTGHTRLDTMSGVGSWLEGLGAWVVHDRHPSNEALPH
jgi:hypothetical protein